MRFERDKIATGPKVLSSQFTAEQICEEDQLTLEESAVDVVILEGNQLITEPFHVGESVVQVLKLKVRPGQHS